MLILILHSPFYIFCLQKFAWREIKQTYDVTKVIESLYVINQFVCIPYMFLRVIKNVHIFLMIVLKEIVVQINK